MNGSLLSSLAVARWAASITMHLQKRMRSCQLKRSVVALEKFCHYASILRNTEISFDCTVTDRLRNKAHWLERFFGVGGGIGDVATWKRAARLFVNSGHGGLPVA